MNRKEGERKRAHGETRFCTKTEGIQAKTPEASCAKTRKREIKERTREHGILP